MSRLTRRAPACVRPCVRSARRSPGLPLRQISRQSVALDPTVDLRLDVADFTTLLAACESHPHRRLDACPACIDRLTQAEALYRDGFLAGFALPNCDAFTAWQTAHQDRLRGQLLALLSHLAAYRLRHQEYDRAISHLQRGLAVAPWQEESHRQLTRALALAGRRSEALNQYEICGRILGEESAVPPAAETTALRDRIAAGMLEPDALETANPYAVSCLR